MVNNRAKLILTLLKSIKNLNPPLTAKEFDTIAQFQSMHGTIIPSLSMLLSTSAEAISEKERMLIMRYILEMNSTLYLRPQTTPIPYVKTIQQFGILIGVPCQTMELLVKIRKIPLGFHKDYKLKNMPSTLMGLAILSPFSLDYIRSIMSLFITHGADINQYFPVAGKDTTLLHYLCEITNSFVSGKLRDDQFQLYVIDRIKILLDFHANISAKDSEGQTPWQVAFKSDKKYLKNILYFDRKHFFPSIPQTIIGMGLVFLALLVYFVRSSSFFSRMKYKPQRNIIERSRQEEKSNLGVVKQDELKSLEKENKNPQEQKEKIKKLEDFIKACSTGNLTECHKLAQIVDCNAYGEDSFTPLMAAAERNQTSVVHFLLELTSLEPQITDAKGKTTALLIAKCHQFSEILNPLSQHLHRKLELIIQRNACDKTVKAFVINYLMGNLEPLAEKWGEEQETLLLYLIRSKLDNTSQYVLEILQKNDPRQINVLNRNDENALILACATGQIKLAGSILNFDNLKTSSNDAKGENAICKILKLPNPPEAFAKRLISRGCKLTTKAHEILTNNASLSKEERDELLNRLKKTVSEQLKQEEIKLEKKLITPIKIHNPSNAHIKIRQNKKFKKIHKKTTDPIKHIEDVKKIYIAVNNPTIHYFKLNRDFFNACLKPLKNLIIIFSTEPESPEEVFYRHTQLLIFILDLFENIQAYNFYLSRQHRNMRDITVIPKEELQEFKYIFRHKILPKILTGELRSKKLTTGIIEAVTETAKDLIELIPDNIIHKVEKNGKKIVLSNIEKHTLTEVFGNKVMHFDEENLPNFFCLEETKLFKILKEFHAGLSNLEFSPLIHEYYLRDFALPVLTHLYQKIATSENVLETQILYPLEKPKKVINLYKVKEFFSDSWLVLMIILISCGDMYIYQSTNNELMVDFVEKCKQQLCNLVMHRKIRFVDFIFPIVNSLCQSANYIVKKEGLREMNWTSTEYNKEYENKFLEKQLVSTLSRYGFLPNLSVKVVDYLGINRKYFNFRGNF